MSCSDGGDVSIHYSNQTHQFSSNSPLVVALKHSARLKFVSVHHLCPGVDFDYDKQKPLFINVDFGIGMESRSECVPLDVHHQHLKYTGGPS